MATYPVIIVVGTVWCYWLSVLVMIARSHVRHRTSAGAVPQTGLERWMWLFWVPTVLAWLVVPILAYTTQGPLVQAPAWAIDNSLPEVSWLAAGAALLAYALTVPCWLTLGSNWSLAVVPHKETTLVTHGFFRRIRHPIYSLGLLLMAATVVVAASPAMVIVALSHLTLVVLKCRSEEAFLRLRHGQKYEDYCQRSGQFFPRLLAKPDAESRVTTERRDAA